MTESTFKRGFAGGLGCGCGGCTLAVALLIAGAAGLYLFLAYLVQRGQAMPQ